MLRKNQKGFTLIELMIVVVIIGILAAIAIPRFANMVTKAKEGACKGNLGALRSAVSIYYANTGGEWPTTLEALVPDYIDEIPVCDVGQKINDEDPSNMVYTDSGTAHHGWYYDANTGTVLVCGWGLTDSNGEYYTSW